MSLINNEITRQRKEKKRKKKDKQNAVDDSTAEINRQTVSDLTYLLLSQGIFHYAHYAPS